jgi:hypothetical protein
MKLLSGTNQFLQKTILRNKNAAEMEEESRKDEIILKSIFKKVEKGKMDSGDLFKFIDYGIKLVFKK